MQKGLIIGILLLGILAVSGCTSVSDSALLERCLYNLCESDADEICQAKGYSEALDVYKSDSGDMCIACKAGDGNYKTLCTWGG